MTKNVLTTKLSGAKRPKTPKIRKFRSAQRKQIQIIPFFLFVLGMAHGKVFKFVLTGGPCGGKTTSLSHISSHLKSLGFEVYVLPETATLLIGSGVQYHGLTREQQLAHESSVIRFQRASEDAFVHRARQNDKPTVLLCDRGLFLRYSSLCDD